ncbi:MAG: hypothetical protein FWG72_08505 [Oscillospiraceae bacterium]|nr:hypothetical protein [Oscillospiraceae bacterium]
MRALYLKVDEILRDVDFNEIWPGFSPCGFALFNENGVFLKDAAIPYDRRFLGNTSIEYDGEPLAIWQVEDPLVEDPELLAADLAHEMFHAFQGQSGERRTPDDLVLLGYPHHAENYEVKHSENLLLAEAALSEDAETKKALLQKFISARKYREKLIGGIIGQEYLTETFEGMAEYAGSMALKQISEGKYRQRLGKYIESLQTLDSRFFEIRRMLYYSGAVFCVLLRKAGIDFYHAVGGTDVPLFSIIAGDAREEKPAARFERNAFNAEIEKHTQEKSRKFEAFSDARKETVTGDFTICGYDPMNMTRQDDRILCGRFVMLKNSGGETRFVQGPVLLVLKKGSAREVLSYTA